MRFAQPVDRRKADFMFSIHATVHRASIQTIYAQERQPTMPPIASPEDAEVN